MSVVRGSIYVDTRKNGEYKTAFPHLASCFYSSKCILHLPQSLQRLCFENKNKFPNEKSSLLRNIIFLLIPLLSSRGPLMGASDLRVAFKGPLNDLLGTSKWPLRMSNLQMALMFLTRQMSFEWPLNSKRTLKWSFKFIAMQRNGVKPRSSEK